MISLVVLAIALLESCLRYAIAISSIIVLKSQNQLGFVINLTDKKMRSHLTQTVQIQETGLNLL